MWNKNPKYAILLVTFMLLLSTLMAPYAHAAINEQALNISLDPVNVIVKDNWQQIKNAAIIQLIAQKMKKCVEVEDVLEGDGIVRSKSEAVEKGQIFNSPIGSGSATQRIGVGVWFSNHFDAGLYDWDGEADGMVYCVENDGKLFNMFVYILQYRSGSTVNLDSFTVSKEQRLKVICSPDSNGNYTQPGILQSSNIWGTANSNACNDESGYYTGLSKDKQLAYLKTVYENMRAASGNNYIVSWDQLGTYSGVVGYYLYSLDFGVQCGTWEGDWSKNDNGAHKRVNPTSGIVEKGNYGSHKSGESGDTARQSFVNGTKTCADLVKEMDDHLPEYVRYINREIYNECESKINEAIDVQTAKIDSILSNSSSTQDQIKDANTVKSEYHNVKKYGKYVADPNAGEGQIVSAKSDGHHYDGNANYVWVCRPKLSFIDVATEEEVNLEEGVDQQFARDYCKEQLELGWVICPVLNAMTNGIDAISEWIDGMF